MPSEKVLEQKKQAVVEIADALKAAQAGVLVDYRGLTVEEDTQLRNNLRAANVKYFVAKNTLIRFAAKQVGLDNLEEVLSGPTALAVSEEDPVAPAKILSDFAKDHEVLEIKSGFMDGAVMSLDEIKTLAATPSKETLIAKMMGSLNSPVSSLVRLLNTIVEGGEEISDLIAKKAGEAAPAEEAKEESPAEEVKEEAAAEETAEAAPAEEVPAEETKEETPAEEEKEDAPAEDAPAE
jgi:large subunit ribosomal protein L10